MGNVGPADDRGSWGGFLRYKDINYYMAAKDHTFTQFGDPSSGQVSRRSIRRTRIYAYTSCSENHECDQGFAVEDRYVFSTDDVCQAGPHELSLHPFIGENSLHRTFKAYGHEGCRLKPNKEALESHEPGYPWGTLTCAKGLSGECTIPETADATTKTCSESAGKSEVWKGTTLKMFAVCDW